MIYKNLKDLRKNNGLTQEQLSEKKEIVYLIYIVYWNYPMSTR